MVQVVTSAKETAISLANGVCLTTAMYKFQFTPINFLFADVCIRDDRVCSVC